MKNLKRELIRAKEEIKRIQSVPLVIGQFNEIIDANYGIVGELHRTSISTSSAGQCSATPPKKKLTLLRFFPCSRSCFSSFYSSGLVREYIRLYCLACAFPQNGILSRLSGGW